ncbi:protein of unknown function DUF955 [Thermanaerovibrio acidaminovorans DSM 6589]|uniref:IrrE N-terminal-like domain-containing protein n=1 Tax=Thermanaerovibrio acidaminovorans (strain ATCC 49978 / DSM 6589 / Su883) TaxID=525903 RepID=D1B716_THEAS|nr:protein of unknown function DUF955 [Thermanaerovibrio acidaminovorans DSM 6589]
MAGLPVDLGDLASRLGVRVLLCQGLGVRGALVTGRRSIVLVDRSLSVFQRRFTAAHELGHLMIHRTGAGRPWEETQADRFASELLVPSWAISPQWLEGLDPHEAAMWVSRRFLVSRSCALRRLRRLGLA